MLKIECLGLIRFAVTPDYTIYGGSKPNQTQTLNFQSFLQPLQMPETYLYAQQISESNTLTIQL